MFEAGELANREGGDGDPFGSPVFDGIAESVASVAALRTLVGVDVLSLSDDECLGVLDDLERARRAVEAVRMAVAVDVERRGCTQARFGHRTGGFLAKRHGLPGGDSHGLVKTGQKLLLTLPEIGAALKAGTISAAQAQTIASATTYRNEAGMRAAQDALIGLAAGSVSFKQFKVDVDGIARLADPDGGHDRVRNGTGCPASGSTTNCTSRAAGRGVGQGVRSGPRRRDQPPVAPLQERPQGSATTSRSRAANNSLRKRWPIWPRRGFASNTKATRAPVVDITLVIREPEAGQFSQNIWGTPRRCTDVNGLRFADHTVDLLTCDPVIHPLLINSEGVPLDLGTEIRFGNHDQRRAAAVRDGGCVFPGCDAPPSWTDLHHVIHAGPDGPTDMWNLASLCRRHHSTVHRRGWTMRTIDDQWFQFVSPTGLVIDSQRHGHQRPPHERPPAPA